MEAKLIKNADAYSVKINNEYVAFANEDFVGYATQKFRDNLLGKLSLSNCQAVANGYDLDEEMCNLVDKKAKQNNQIDLNAYGQGCLDAFQKALEILGDKKFSEEDMKKAIYIAWEGGDLASTHIIESLQKTEWDVEIVMETCQVMVQHGDMEFQDFPKLDADGYLILKRI